MEEQLLLQILHILLFFWISVTKVNGKKQQNFADLLNNLYFGLVLLLPP
jgi:preprotein translocase subunit YajC